MRLHNQETVRERSPGIGVVEFAVAAPLLVIMVFGMVEASRLYEMQNQLLMAAREGARLAAMQREGILARANR